MTVGDKLSQGAVQVQDAWTSLTDTWMQTAQDLLRAGSVNPFELFQPDAAMDQMFDLAQRAFEINTDLIRSLTGVSVRVEHVVVTASSPLASAATGVERIEPVIDAVSTIVEPAVEAAVQAAVEAAVEAEGEAAVEPAPVGVGSYSRMSKAELQDALAGRQLPTSGTVKQLRDRLVEPDRRPAPGE